MGAEVAKMCGGDEDGDGIPDALEEFIPDELSVERIVEAIMDALERGVRFAVERASAAGGFLSNPSIHIPWPEEFQNVREKLEKLNFKESCQEFVDALNAAAEQAAGSAVDIFVGAIRGLSFDHAREILDGGMDAATNFMREMCVEPLKELFKPIVDAALEAVDVTELWEKLVKAYNKIPFVDDIDFDLEDYAVGRCIDGLFHLIKEKEAEIRANPMAEGSELLESVFSQAAGFAGAS